MRSTSIVAVAVAVVLMLAVSFSSGLASVGLPRPVESFIQFEWLIKIPLKVYKGLYWRCDEKIVDEKYCDILNVVVRHIQLI